MENINNLNESTVDKILAPYQDELPPARLNMAKQLVMRRANWMSEYYDKNKSESRVASRRNTK